MFPFSYDELKMFSVKYHTLIFYDDIYANKVF